MGDEQINSYLGLPTLGVIMSDPLHMQISRYFTGEKTIREIARGMMIEEQIVQSFADFLSDEGLLEYATICESAGRTGLSESLSKARREPEQRLISHRPSNSDGGLSEFEARENFNILISGENRIARNLFITLLGMGFTHTRLISRGNLTDRITVNDVCGIAVRTSDVGRNRREFSQEIIRSSRISASTSVGKSEPDLIISTVAVEWDYVQRWMSEGSQHIHINPIIGHEIEIGPLVIPGRTPCLRCVTLNKRDLGIPVELEFIRSEYPLAAISLIAGAIALGVSEYFATKTSPLLAASHWYDLLSPFKPSERRHWNFHPECGCR